MHKHIKTHPFNQDYRLFQHATPQCHSRLHHTWDIQEVSKLSLVAYGCPNFGAEFRTFCTQLSYFMILYLRQSKHMGYTPICIYSNYKIVWYGGLILFYWVLSILKKSLEAFICTLNAIFNYNTSIDMKENKDNPRVLWSFNTHTYQLNKHVWYMCISAWKKGS